MVTPALSLLVLSEDSSAYAHETVSAVVRKMLPLVERHVRTHRVRFQPTGARLVVRANMWRSKRPHPQLVDLRREIARTILEDGVPGYVLFHFDGDCPWSERRASTLTAQFHQFVRSLAPLVEQNLRERGVLRDDVDVAAQVEERLRRICEVVPHYSIESWLYQNAARVRELCRQRCGKHVELIEQWQQDRALLDDVVKPKKQLCFGSEANRDLAEKLTHQLTDELYLLGQSFHATVERLQSCPGLQDALRATWANADDGSKG
jgi:hypothetical protein